MGRTEVMEAQSWTKKRFWANHDNTIKENSLQTWRESWQGFAEIPSDVGLVTVWVVMKNKQEEVLPRQSGQSLQSLLSI